MFNRLKNSKKQGDAGVGAAISFFTINGMPVSIPLTDSQDYDLVVEIDGGLKKVQVKTTGYAERKNYVVNLRVMGGNKSGYSSKAGTDIVYDYLFVLTEEGDRYFIPKTYFAENRNSLTLGDDVKQFQV